MQRLSEALYFSVLTFWVGGLWAIGYVVVPLLFMTMGDRQLAGLVAGKIFTVFGWSGLGCAAYLIGFLARRWGRELFRRSVFWLVLLMAILVAINLLGVLPLIAQLKAEALPGDVMESALRERFAAWHGVSSILYLLQSLLGLWLVVWANRGLR